jgi:aspartate carbamoyltransferase catalytic subunit
VAQSPPLNKAAIQRNPRQPGANKDDSRESQTGATSRHPDFMYAALDTTACAAFIKESMKFANTNQIHGKSGLPGVTVPSALACSRSLLSVTSLSVEDVCGILRLASLLEAEPPEARALRLAHRRVALLFYESSTRTRTSFELAAKGLGADTALISSQSSSIEKGESLKDTGITLRALGAECIILRHLSSGAPYLLAQATGLPILNAGDGMHEHPSQALLDLRTILLELNRPQEPVGGMLQGITVTIVGDILHSRVARSNALLLPCLGARVIFCGPPALLPEVAQGMGPGITIERDFDSALQQAKIVMMLRIQKERLAGVHIDLDEYVARYQLHRERLRACGPQAIVMHPGPMIRGLEITTDVADGPQSLIEKQVRNGVAIRMALIHRALAPEQPPKAKRSESKPMPQAVTSKKRGRA